MSGSYTGGPQKTIKLSKLRGWALAQGWVLAQYYSSGYFSQGVIFVIFAVNRVDLQKIN